MVESWMAILAVAEVVIAVAALFAALKVSGEVHRKADRELQMRWEHADPQSRRRWEARRGEEPSRSLNPQRRPDSSLRGVLEVNSNATAATGWSRGPFRSIGDSEARHWTSGVCRQRRIELDELGKRSLERSHRPSRRRMTGYTVPTL